VYMCFLLVGELYISLAMLSSSYLFISFINNGSSQLLTANLLQKSFPQSGQPLSSYHIAEDNIIDIPGLQCYLSEGRLWFFFSIKKHANLSLLYSLLQASRTSSMHFFTTATLHTAKQRSELHSKIGVKVLTKGAFQMWE